MKDYTSYIGIPFLTGGRNTSGVDCWGLAMIVQQEQFNVDLPDVTTYSNALNVLSVIHTIKEQTPIIGNTELTEPVEGCLVLMGESVWASHIGIYIGNNNVLHTTKKTGVIIERLTSKRIKNRIRGYYSVN